MDTSYGVLWAFGFLCMVALLIALYRSNKDE